MREKPLAHILIMEDDELQSALFAAGLRGIDHEVTVAHSGTEALKLLSERAFDLLITDIIVNRDGRSVADGGVLLIGRLRSGNANPTLRANAQIPIIAMSGAVSHIGMENILNMAQGIGADEVLAKPFFPGDMHEVVTRLLGNDQLA